MLSRYPVFVAGILIALAALWFLRPSEEQRILDRLEQLRAESEITVSEGGIELLARSAAIADFFDEHTEFDLGNIGHRRIEIDSRDELTQRIIRIRARLSRLELAMRDARVSITDGTAEVVLTGSGLGQVVGEREPFLEIHTVAVRLRRDKNGWIITGATHLRDERRLPSEQSD